MGSCLNSLSTAQDCKYGSHDWEHRGRLCHPEDAQAEVGCQAIHVVVMSGLEHRQVVDLGSSLSEFQGADSPLDSAPSAPPPHRVERVAAPRCRIDRLDRAAVLEAADDAVVRAMLG